MAIMDIKVGGGRKPVMARVDGELVIIKKASVFGTSKALFLPREWLLAIELKQHQQPEKFTLSYNAEVLTVKPYFGDEG